MDAPDLPNAANGTYDSPKDIGLSPSAIVRRWNTELALSEKNEKAWRDKSNSIFKRYRIDARKKNSFNILWSNTETLRPAIYKSSPKPDIRRRFRDDDKLGKAVSEVLTRCIEYTIDDYDFDKTLIDALMDSLICGRGIVRVKYIPYVDKIEDEENSDDVDDGYDQLTDEKVECCHVNWEDYRYGPARSRDELGWEAFRHRLNREQCTEQFGELGSTIPLDSVADESIKKSNDYISDIFKTLEVWEIWDKEAKQIIFIAPTYRDSPLKTLDDPLGLNGFFCTPRPFYAIEDPGSLIPIPLYEQYKEQAEELDRVSARINKIMDGLKMRGLYDSTLKEMKTLVDSDDNALIAAENVITLADRGGLDKFIWMMPIETAANVIKILLEQREACKAVIYEIAGIGDIMRAASDPSETFGAQKLKSQWGSQRLQKMQREFQRFIRDIVRLKCEVISNKFQLDTIKKMSQMKLPTNIERNLMLMQQSQPQMPGPM